MLIQTILFSSKWFLSKVLLLSNYACLNASCRCSSQQLWQSLLSRVVHRHEASRQPCCVIFFPLISSVGFVVFLFCPWINQSVFLIPSDWPDGTMWNINVIFKRSRLKTITHMEPKKLTLFVKRIIKVCKSNEVPVIAKVTFVKVLISFLYFLPSCQTIKLKLSQDLEGCWSLLIFRCWNWRAPTLNRVGLVLLSCPTM